MNRPKVILDSKGLFTHMFHRGNDPDSILTQDGTLVNRAGWGFVNWLDEYILPMMNNGFRPVDIIAAYDGGNDYRKAVYPAYKAHRDEQKKKDPVEKAQQLKLLEEAVKVFLANIGAINIQCKGVEADDTIAALCKGYSGHPKVVHSVDADLLQLVDDSTVVFLKNEPVTDKYFHKDYRNGIPFHLLKLNKALVGDKSDGYGGVYRFGPKAWEKLEEEIGVDGLEEIDQCFFTGKFQPLEEAVELTKSKLLSHILSNLKDAKLCYDLATLHPEICHQFRGNELVWPTYYTRVPSREKVMNVLNQMGCPDYLHHFEHLFPQEMLASGAEWTEAESHFLRHLEESPFVSFDYETYDTLKHPDFQVAKKKGEYVDVLSQEITGASFNYGPDLQYTVYLPVAHKDTDNMLPEIIVTFLSAIADKNVPLVVQNASFEELVTRLNLDIEIVKPYDTQIMSSYVNENELSGLKFISKQYLNYSQASYKDTLEAAGAKDMTELTGAQVLSYGCDDSLVTAHLCKLFGVIMRMEGTWDFYDRYERAPVHVLTDAFETGVRLDFDKIKVLHKKAEEVIDSSMSRIRELLLSHCNIPCLEAEASALRLDEADGKNLVAIQRFKDTKAGKPRSDDSYLAMREELKLKWENAAEYFPYSETHIPPTFLGTHTQLNIVIEQLGIDLETLKILAVSRPKLNLFLTEVKALPDAPDPRLEQFCSLLADATGTPISKRTGPQFEALTTFCLPFLGDGKTVSEGDELNFGSPQQMQELLYCKLGLPVRRRSKVQKGSSRDQLGLVGSPSTNEEAMQLAIAEDCQEEEAEWKRELLTLVMSVKEHQTLISLYYVPYPLWKHPRDGMVHPGIKNCGTVTRRPSGTDPNLLAVKKGETRTVYRPRYDDHVIVALDFSGQELRITGSEANDPTLIDAYIGGGSYTDEDGMTHPVTKDVHSVTAISFASTIFQRELGTADFDFAYESFREMLNSNDEKVQKSALLCRKMAKVVNFLIIYGGSAMTLAMRLGIPESFAEELMRQVFANYDRIAPWQEETIQFARQWGFVRTAYGSIKHLTSDIRSKDGSLRSRQERQAVNSKIQGCAADILKVVLTGSYESNLWEDTKSHLVAPVYDELVSSVPAIHVFEYCERLQDLMNITPPRHAIPMMAEVSVGPDWGSVIELGDRPSERKLIECVEGFRS